MAFNEALSKLEETLEAVQTIASGMAETTEADKLSDSALALVLSDLNLGDKNKVGEDGEKLPPDESFDELQMDVAKWIDSSQQYSLWELKSVAKKKAAYLNALRL